MSKRRRRGKTNPQRETMGRETEPGAGGSGPSADTNEAGGAGKAAESVRPVSLESSGADKPPGGDDSVRDSGADGQATQGGAVEGRPVGAKATAGKWGGENFVENFVGGKPNLLPQLPSLARVMSVVMLVVGILGIGVLFYQVMAGFFVPLFLAALLVVIFRPVYLSLLARTHQRRRLSAGLTTALILFIVLLPLGVVISVATSQFTVLLSRMNGSASVALDRIRDQVGLSLPHAEYFRELDQITNSMGVKGLPQATADSESVANHPGGLVVKAKQLDKAAAIVKFLQANVEGPESSVEAAEQAVETLNDYSDSLREAAEQELAANSAGEINPLLRLNVSEEFEQVSVHAAASVRTWMHLKLGGALQSQMKLLANPDEADFSRLIRGARESLQPRFVKLTSATGSMLAKVLFGLMILVISIYFFLIDGPKMTSTLMRLSPLDDSYERQLLTQFDQTSRAVVIASVASAVVQGILATIGFWLTGFDQIVLFLFLTSLMALVPFLGAASVWVPCALWLGFVEQRWIAAGLLALWGAAVVSSIDNVIKVYVLQGRSQLHPLFALLSVIGGVSVFGPIGILVGPMVVVFLQTLLEILNHEIQDA
ncbi:AI-2E family transporter [Allorhodopirellula solitaria]|uniref:Putative inner membrane protein n=1 Tax=Allorhodopirellula solitaria TaxID=2527987 RepID=A0A5C5YIV4_9BACT|nr:AI-2E family transporter [Allorhodopirellula solitaria]TWT74789.1 putative inner membrane protein [Allorhodopirellula solitaria]